MTIEIIAARDEMFGMFTTAWDAGAAAITGLPFAPRIFYQNTSNKQTASDKVVGPAHDYWVRISAVTADERQRTFPTNATERRNTVDGQLFMQIFAPVATQDSGDKGHKLAKLARDTFKFKRSEPSREIRFGKVRIEELPQDQTWWAWLVTAEYQFDELITLAA